jgi:hypothetical protein
MLLGTAGFLRPGTVLQTHVSRRSVGLMMLFAADCSIVHLLSWTHIRYRLPVDAVMVGSA